jgi:hypothetical protein
MAQSKTTRRPKGTGSETKGANGRWHAIRETPMHTFEQCILSDSA